MAGSSSGSGGGGNQERYVLQVYVGSLSRLYEALSIEASKTTTAEEIVDCIAEKLLIKDGPCYELAEVMADSAGGQDCKERRLAAGEYPVALQLLWPKASAADYKFCLRRKMQTMNWSLSWTDTNDKLIRDYFLRFLYQPRDREYPDLCQLPDLTEQTLLDNLKARFDKGHIYTYVGSILIAVNPFKFYPIYNPKYVQLYQNRRLGELPPHIFAIADAAYQAMLKKQSNQCIVISGESGSGKTESTNLLLHHLTALAQKGTHGSGVEQTILGAGPVLEAFGNAKTKHNNNSSRFGKFIQVNYKENGQVHGAVVQKYLLEKSRIVSQVKSERNYHVFYYLLAGATQQDKESLYLGKPCDYNYLNQSKCYTLDGVDESYEFARLQQSMEMVGFSQEKQNRCFRVLSAVLYLGNVQFSKKSTYHSDETVLISNPGVVEIISKLLLVKEETLSTALTCKRTKAAKGETLVINYKMADAIAARDAMAKCLYGALFDWIVMQVNHALLAKKDFRDHKGHYIGVLDIFGFEDFGDQNNFEQFCINYANEHLQFYFNQHVFKYEQEEYIRESINWRNIDFIDNIDCLNLIEGRPHGLLYLLDDQCNFPGANNETVLQKFVNHHKNNALFEVPPCRPAPAFMIKHYAGKVKYQIRDFREKNMDLMRPDIVSVLKVSQMAFVRELVGADPLAIFRWQILKAFFRAYFIFSKLREMSKMKRGLNDNFIISEINTRKTTRTSFDAKKQLLKHKAIAQQKLQNKSKGIEKSIRNLKTLKQLMAPPIGSSSSATSGGGGGITSGGHIPAYHTKSHSDRTLPRTGRKQTPTVTHQFHHSLQQLMDALNLANPFFVRCIKSNGDKIANHFDDVLVLLQLRYTGMLETVRIRQSGYSVRLSYDEFIQHYRILLAKGLLSSQSDVKHFLSLMSLNRDNYQIGKSKIFMRESEKLILDERLHQEILRRIITLQRWVRTWILRRRFKEMRDAAIIIQCHTRRWMAQQRLSRLKQIAAIENWAANCIQKNWRSFQQKQWFEKLRRSTILFQSHCRGFLLRGKVLSQKMTQSQQLLQQQSRQQSRSSIGTPSSVPSSPSVGDSGKTMFSSGGVGGGCHESSRKSSQIPIDSQSSHSDEAFLSKGSSQEELLDSIPIRPSVHLYQQMYQKLDQQSQQQQQQLTSSTTTPEPNLSSTEQLATGIAGRGITTKEALEDIESGIHDSEDIDSDTEPQPPTSAATTPAPVLPPKKRLSTDRPLKTYDFDDEYYDDDDNDMSPEYEDDLEDTTRLDRRRNRVVRKLSLRKSKSNKVIMSDMVSSSSSLATGGQHELGTGVGSSSSISGGGTSGGGGGSGLGSPMGVKFESSSNNSAAAVTFRDHRPVAKIASDSSALIYQQKQRQQQQNQFVEPLESSSSLTNVIVKEAKVSKTGLASHQQQSQQSLLQQQQSHGKTTSVSSDSSGGALQKAKKTLKTIIGKSSDKSSKVSSKPTPAMMAAMKPLCYDSGPEEVSLLCSSSHRSAVIKRPSKSYESQSSSGGPPLPAPVGSGRDFSLMNGHSVRPQLHFRSGELCAVCENPMHTKGQPHTTTTNNNVGVKCEECKLLFHNKCVHSCHQIPCRSSSSTPSNSSNSTSSILLAPINVNTNPNPSRPPRSKHRKGGKNWKNSSAKENTSSAANTGVGGGGGQRSQSARDSQASSWSSGSGGWSVTRTAEFVDPKDILITDCDELLAMDNFILTKVYEMDEYMRRSRVKESTVDVVFKLALKEFRSNLISHYSVAAMDGHLRLTYKNLIDHFEQVILNICQKENTWKSFPVIMGVNAFRGYLDQLRQKQSEWQREKHSMEKSKSDTFVTQLVNSGSGAGGGGDTKLIAHSVLEAPASTKVSKSKRKRHKKSRKSGHSPETEVFEMCGHHFMLSMANIPTVCEVCSSLMWLMEKIWVCSLCKMACHKKCATKLSTTCRIHEMSRAARDGGRGQKGGRPQIFGARLQDLVTDECRIPPILEHLITNIELKGLYTEGLYRKSGTTSKINELKRELELRGSEVDLDSYAIHVLTAALKSFFREMAEPLMTYELYDDFLWTTAITDHQEKVQSIYSSIGKLPRANYDVLERLVFHLARVAQQESANRMTANSLAIVFAPCILRTDKVMQMQDKLMDISKQTVCIECIISTRMLQIADTLADIDILDTACHTASSRLSSLRLSKLHLNRDMGQPSSTGMSVHHRHDDDDDEEEEAILTQQIHHLITEKNHLTEILPSFLMANNGSDDEMLSSVTDLAGDPMTAHNTAVNAQFQQQQHNIGDEVNNFILQSHNNRKSAPEFTGLQSSCGLFMRSGDEPLNHLTKNRVSAPNRRKPSRFEGASATQKAADNTSDTTNGCQQQRTGGGGGGGDRRQSDDEYLKQYLDNDKPVMV